ncbi:MAG: NAD-dependent epimerase/dehydratase family protein [Deltaproteobacteria bacterium]|nr:NAD-dependent epimerase/dehydratase family protein [Deltaproteobacteria bacterium]
MKGATEKPFKQNTQSSAKPTCWLVTGGCGFIGTNLIKQLISEEGHIIRVVDNLSAGNREDLAAVCDYVEIDINSIANADAGDESPGSLDDTIPPVELIVGDILDNKIALRAAVGVDVIVHLAASTGVGPSVEDPRSDCMNNVIGTLNYLEAARTNGIGRFIFASSGAPVGECQPPIHEELAPHPVSPYGAGKLAGEAYCSAYYRTFGIETVALRFGNVYGPGSCQKDSVVARFIRRATHGETLEIYGDGSQTRDFIYIDDLTRAIRSAATVDEIGGEVFQIATNAETTVAELVDKLIPFLADQGINNIQVSHKAPRMGDVLRNFSDTSKAREILGWGAEVKIEEGLKLTVEWFDQISRNRVSTNS